MKIMCTLREFTLLSARCPMCTFLVPEQKIEKMLFECHQKCMLSNFCKYGMDDSDWELSDLVEIVRSEDA
jgi:hypothetical protein